MSELTYLNLSFRCDNMIKHISSPNTAINKTLIKDAKNLLLDCVSIESTESLLKQFTKNTMYTPSVLTPLILDVFEDKTISEIVKTLNDYIEILDEYIDKGKVHYKKREALSKFFKKTSEVSFDYSTYIIRNKELELENNAVTFSPISI